MEKLLLHGEVRTVTFTSQTEDTKDVNVTFNGKAYKIRAWYVSILLGCNDEVYNTAKVNTQTSLMARRAANLVANKHMDQKEVANDTSDYLWYITNVMVNEGDPLLGKSNSLQVDTSGHIVHTFVNGSYIGTQFATVGNYKSRFQKNVQLVKGQNQIALLNATIGFTNYGAFFDLVPAAVTGPLVLVSSINNTTVTRDLSINQWVYKVGLPGELRKFYDVTSRFGRHGWQEDLLANRKFVWCKATFDTPIGTDPVDLDFKGLGKGHAWVNGKSIGRYWTSMLASTDGCSLTCDYVGPYSDKKCLSNCGNPSQRWYHVLRSFLNDEGSSTLVLFEEFGGNPSFVTVQTLTVDHACADAYEGSTLELSCQGGQRISKISTASFGNPTGKECGNQQGTCKSLTAVAAVTWACVGKPSCSITVSEAFLGTSNCNDSQPRRLAVVAVC
ncbi:Beta-galactosidase 7 [Ancistrocladus abbreviatus]